MQSIKMIIHQGSYAKICVQDIARNYLANLYRLAVFVSRCARWERIEYISGVKIFQFIIISRSIRNIIMHGIMCDGMGGKYLSSYCYHTMIASTGLLIFGSYRASGEDSKNLLIFGSYRASVKKIRAFVWI